MRSQRLANDSPSSPPCSNWKIASRSGPNTDGQEHARGEARRDGHRVRRRIEHIRLEDDGEEGARDGSREVEQVVDELREEALAVARQKPGVVAGLRWLEVRCLGRRRERILLGSLAHGTHQEITRTDGGQRRAAGGPYFCVRSWTRSATKRTASGGVSGMIP